MPSSLSAWFILKQDSSFDSLGFDSLEGGGVAHRVAHRVAHGPGPRSCPHPNTHGLLQAILSNEITLFRKFGISSQFFGDIHGKDFEFPEF